MQKILNFFLKNSAYTFVETGIHCQNVSLNLEFGFNHLCFILYRRVTIKPPGHQVALQTFLLPRLTGCCALNKNNNLDQFGMLILNFSLLGYLSHSLTYLSWLCVLNVLQVLHILGNYPTMICMPIPEHANLDFTFTKHFHIPPSSSGQI